MKLHHLRTAFLVTCLLLVCSQGESQTFNNDTTNDGSGWIYVAGESIGYSTTYEMITTTIDIPCHHHQCLPEPTTLSLLAMSLLFAGRRWR